MSKIKIKIDGKAIKNIETYHIQGYEGTKNPARIEAEITAKRHFKLAVGSILKNICFYIYSGGHYYSRQGRVARVKNETSFGGIKHGELELYLSNVEMRI